MAGPAARGAHERVDGLGAAGLGRKGFDERERLDLVRHREVHAGEAFGVQERKRFRQFFGSDVQAMVAHAGETRVCREELRKRGVVHCRAERVRDRVAQHTELAGGELGRPQGRQREGVRRAHGFSPGRGRS